VVVLDVPERQAGAAGEEQEGEQPGACGSVHGADGEDEQVVEGHEQEGVQGAEAPLAPVLVLGGGSAQAAPGLRGELVVGDLPV